MSKRIGLLFFMCFFSLMGVGQKKTDFFEPYFDNNYCFHQALYSRFDLEEYYPTHYSDFYNQYFKVHKISRVIKNIFFNSGLIIKEIFFYKNGFLIKYEKYSFQNYQKYWEGENDNREVKKYSYSNNNEIFILDSVKNVVSRIKYDRFNRIKEKELYKQINNNYLYKYFYDTCGNLRNISSNRIKIDIDVNRIYSVNNIDTENLTQVINLVDSDDLHKTTMNNMYFYMNDIKLRGLFYAYNTTLFIKSYKDVFYKYTDIYFFKMNGTIDSVIFYKNIYNDLSKLLRTATTSSGCDYKEDVVICKYVAHVGQIKSDITYTDYNNNTIIYSYE